jgi:hypothetical protein
MNKENEDLWLDHIMAKASWPEPSADLHVRIMQKIDGGSIRAPKDNPIWRTLSFTGLVFVGFAIGCFQQSPVVNNMVYFDAAYYSDAHFEYSNILGS